MDIKPIGLTGRRDIRHVEESKRDMLDSIALAFAIPAYLLRPCEVLQPASPRDASGVQTFTVRGDRYGTRITTHTDRLREVPGGFIFI